MRVFLDISDGKVKNCFLATDDLSESAPLGAIGDSVKTYKKEMDEYWDY